MASRNGLNPKIRGVKGVGFNRALPAPFGFGNGIVAKNSSVRVPGLERGWQYTSDCSFEFWTRCNAGNGSGLFFIWAYIQKTPNPVVSVNYNVNGPLGMGSTDGSYQTAGGLHNYDGSRQHIVYSANGDGKYRVYYNGTYQSTLPGQLNSFVPDVFNLFSSGTAANSPYDEVRFYDKPLSPEEVFLNYNGGIGANPSVTEHLLFWYQFEKFEVLDFSALQDGSDIRLGIRDMSNKNNHGLPINMDTNPASPTYSLQPF